ncbi:N-formylkynurenine (Aryl-) formamidase [Serratia rubidaea]|uniref:cyclase family protein n=1 Tax=Serratia rubidaea TaxID=61652 RepID=UPI00078B0028|nr:cyclase family protein [Serratia rubidaea]AML56183.1 N-formylkynurenine (Aryl-) formamidase [Serratia rubidaea]
MKRIEVHHRGRCHHIDHREPLRLSARLNFADNPTNLYGVAPADSAPLSYGDAVASVRQGGACNAERISLVAHCHGTHTECIGHILPDAHNVADLQLEPFIAATLIRVAPQRADTTTESYNASASSEDWLITRSALDDALTPLSGDYLQALVVGTDAGSEFPASACAPYFSHQAMARIVELGVQHLLVDIPSIDRLYDGGRMDNHRCFWGLDVPDRRQTARRHASVTELIQVPTHAAAGHYFLTIQLPDLAGDALPSRPILFSFSTGKVTS